MLAYVMNFALVLAQATDTTSTGGEGGGDSGGGLFSGGSLQLIVYLAIFVGIFYFLLIRPGQKQKKAHQELVETLKKGDEIMTAGGIFGVITQVKDEYVMVEIAKKTEIKLSRNSIARTTRPEGAVEEEEDEEEEGSGEEKS